MSHIYLHCILPQNLLNSSAIKMDTLGSLLNDLSYFMTLSSMSIWALEIPKLTRKIRRLLPLSAQDADGIINILHHGTTNEDENLKNIFLCDIAAGDLSDLLDDDLDLLDDIASVCRSISGCYPFFYDCDVARNKVAEGHTVSKIMKGMLYSLNVLSDAVRDGQKMETTDGRISLQFPIWNSTEAYVMGNMSRTEFITGVLDPSSYLWYKPSHCFNVLIGFNKYINK
uniref:p26 protein n=1 Tax=Little cherry virus 2 TaxID=154339 RepID=A0A514YC58_9CLOS|nr:p26 protein [Little cherry virus 2]